MLRADPSRLLHREAPPERDNGRGAFDLAVMLRLLRCNRRLIGLAVAAVTALGLIYALTSDPLYLASSQILIDARRTRVDPTGAGGGNNLSLVELGMDPASVDSQVEVLRSERIARMVLRQLRPDRDPGFTAPTTLPGRLVAALRRDFTSAPAPPSDDAIPADTVASFAKRLDVRRVQQTYVIAVTFYDRSPERAAAITNAVTAAYLESQLQANSEAVRHTSTWLKRRIGEVRDEAAAADLAVQHFKAEHGIVESGTGPLVSEAQMNELSSALVKARADAAQSGAREAQLRRVIDTGDASLGLDASLGSDALNRLRDQRADLTRREAEIVRRFGSDHITARGLRGEIGETDRLVLEELRRLAEAAAGNLGVARARAASLERSVAEMGRSTATTNAAQVILRGLERDFDGLKTLYGSLLARYNASLQQESFPVSEARVLAEARPPEHRNQPNTLLILAFSALGGLAAAIVAILMRELGDRSFRLPHQVETVLGLPFLGVLPALRGRRMPARVGGPSPTRDGSTRFVETLRGVRAEIDNRTYHDGARIVGIVATVRGEGTTTVAASLAGLVAADGRRVLLVDANPRAEKPPQPATEAAATPPPAADHGTLRRAVAGSAAEFREIVARSGRTCDYVIADLPPLAPGAELRALAPLLNVFVLVLAWGRTDRATAAEALRALPLVHDRLAGAVLNATDIPAFRRAAQGTSDVFYVPTATAGTSA